MNTKGYVYIFQCEKYYKIGTTTGDIRKRLAAVQVGNPFEITIVHFIPTDQPSRAEKFFHLKFGNKRIRNEWFELTAADVDWLKKINTISGQYLERFDTSQPKPVARHAKAIKTCPVCGVVFTADTQKSPRRLYCSESCQSRGVARLARERQKANPVPRQKHPPLYDEDLPF